MNGHRIMGWSAMPLLFFVLAGAPSEGCSAPQAGEQVSSRDLPPAEQQARSVPAGQDTGAWHLPYFGFNARGMMDVDVQTKYANAFFDQIPARIRENMAIRVTAGTNSQLTYAKDWTPDIINAWADFQKKQGVRLIYVVNGNDTPANQAEAIQKWMDAGAHFDFIEMMNEYYLPKYQKGDLSKEEVKEQVTAEKYVNTILPNFWKELDRFSLPYYLIFAPSKPGQKAASENSDRWNEVIADAIKNKYPDRQLNATVHLYLRGSSDLNAFDYDQIDRLRKDMPAGRHIAVTEAGVVDPSMSSQESGQVTVSHYRNILKHLRPGDYLLDQILYNPGKKNNTTALSPQANGETMKGKAILQFIKNRLD